MTRLVDRDLQSLRDLCLKMGGLAEAILEKSLVALHERSEILASEVKRDDLEIDRLDVAIDDAVLNLLARHAPVAADLRIVLATKSAANDLERVGDLARNIAKSATRLAQRERIVIPAKLDQLADEARRLLRLALDSYSALDPDLARRVMEGDDAIDEDEARVVRSVIAEIAARPEASAQGVDLILIAKNLERVGDHATNIAEDVIHAAEAQNIKHAEKLAARSG